MDCSMPGFPVHYLLEFAQIHVHWADDAVEPSHPLQLPSPFAFNLSQPQGLFHWVSSLHQVATGASTSAAVLPMNIQGWFPLGLTLLAVQESSPAPGGLRLSLILYSWINRLYAPGKLINSELLFSSVQSLSHVRLFVTPWPAAHQASLFITNSRSKLLLIMCKCLHAQASKLFFLINSTL